MNIQFIIVAALFVISFSYIIYKTVSKVKKKLKSNKCDECPVSKGKGCSCGD